jgi:predicted DCC family thiol-disulfide oxidoreductase YuxK
MIKDKVILFDGSCVLCNRTFQWILKADKKAVFNFGTLQDTRVQKRLAGTEAFLHLPHSESMDSVILLEGEKIFFKSSAVIRICFHLGGAYKLMVVFWLVPKFIRDTIYSFIATNRFKWFGKQACYLPDEATKNRFI